MVVHIILSDILYRMAIKMNSKRIALWDNLKFILITLVVVGHFADCFTSQSNVCKSIYLFIYAFHMPLFFFISGRFYNDRKITSKCLYYVSLGFLLKIIISICSTITTGNAKFYLLSDGGIPWFLFAMAIYTSITYLMRNQNKKYLLIAVIVLACFVGYDCSIGDYLYISRAIIFFPFYLAGTMVKDETIAKIKSNRFIIVLSVVIFLVWAYLCFFELETFYTYRHLFTGKNPFSNEVLSYGPLARILCYIISALTCLALTVLTPNKNIKWFTKMGTRSLDVYFWHWPIFMLINYYFHISNLFNYGIYGKAAFLLMAVLLSMLLSQGGIISYPLKKIKTYCYDMPVNAKQINNQNNSVSNG